MTDVSFGFNKITPQCIQPGQVWRYSERRVWNTFFHGMMTWTGRCTHQTLWRQSFSCRAIWKANFMKHVLPASFSRSSIF